jgi:hypothetical protein
LLTHNAECQKLLTGLTSEPLTEVEKTAWKNIQSKVAEVAKGNQPLESLTESERTLGARKYLSEAFKPKGSLSPTGVTNYQLDRANYMMNGGNAPGKLLDYLRIGGY